MTSTYLIVELLIFLTFGTLATVLKNNNENLLKRITITIFLLFLLSNPVQLIFIVEANSLQIASVIASELIAACNFIVFLMKPQQDLIFSRLSLLITALLIGIVAATDFLVIIGCFAPLTYFLMIYYYFSGVKKDYRDYITPIISFIAAIFLLMTYSVILISLTGSSSLNTISDLHQTADFTLILLLFGFGIVSGIFPFMFIYYRYYKDSTFQNLIIFVIVQNSFSFALIRILFLIETLELFFGIFFITIGILGILVGLINIIRDFFFHFGKTAVSLRRTLGHVFLLDFSDLLLLFSFFFITRNNSLINSFLIYLFFIFIANLLLLIPLNFELGTNDTDNFRKIGNLIQKNKVLGISALISGLFFAFPGSFISFNVILEVLELTVVQSNIILLVIFNLVIIYHSIFLILNSVIFSMIGIKVNHSKYIKKS